MNKRTMLSQRNVYMRLALEKFLSSKCVEYLDKEELANLNSAFLSLTPGENIHVFKLEVVFPLEKKSIFRGIVAVVSFAWNVAKENEVDKQGNLWSVYEFMPTLSLKERYSLSGEILKYWVECISSILHLLDDIKSLNIPRKVKEMTCTNEERLRIELQKKYEESCAALSRYFRTSEGKKLRLNLRKKGKQKKIPLKFISEFLLDSSRKKYEFKVRENDSSYFSKYRRYSILVENDCALIRREE